MINHGLKRKYPNVKRMMSILKEEPPSKKRVYYLIGNEPIHTCIESTEEYRMGRRTILPIGHATQLSRWTYEDTL